MRLSSVDPFGFNTPLSAIVFGSTGGIGGAVSAQIQTAFAAQNTTQSTDQNDGQTGTSETRTQNPEPVENRGYNPVHHVYEVNRSSPPKNPFGTTSLQANPLDETQLSVTMDAIRADIALNERHAVRLIFVGIGTLHRLQMSGQTHDQPPNQQTIGPEKSWRDLSADSMAEIFATNTIAPALIAKHVLPLLPRTGRAVFAVLSARVGSISDNRLGGWYSYRASKAALNQIIKTTSIELARTQPEAICLGLHPGTVDTDLSKPFQANVARDKLFTPQVSANHLLRVIGNATPAQTGSVLAWDGSVVPA